MGAAEKLDFTPDFLPDNEHVRRAAAGLDPAALAEKLADPENQAALAALAGAPDTPGRGMAILHLVNAGLYQMPDPRPEPPRKPGRGGSPLKLIREAAEGPPARPDALMTCAADVDREDVVYLWPGRVVWDRVTIFMGMPGQGKSHLMTWLTAMVTSGGAWPDCPGNAQVGSVIIFQAEESRGADIADRLVAFGADVNRVHYFDKVVRDGRHRRFSFARDCDALEVALDRIGDVRLVYFDPIEAYMGETSMRSGEAMYDALMPLKDLTERRKFAAVIVAHPNKNGEQDMIHRLAGSQGIGAIARTLWYVSEDPNNPNRRMISHAKGNPRGIVTTPIAFALVGDTLEFDSDCGAMRAKHVEFLLQRNLKQEALRAGRRGPDPVKADASRDLILEALSAGPELRAKVKRLALERGIPVSTFGRSLKALVAEGRVCVVPVEGDPRHWIGLITSAEAEPGEGSEGPIHAGNLARDEEST